MRLPSNSLNRIALRATAAVVVRHPEGEFVAQYDERYEDAVFDPADIESSGPTLSAVCTVDVQALTKGTPLEITTGPHAGDSYRFLKHEPDGTGMSRVILML